MEPTSIRVKSPRGGQKGNPQGPKGPAGREDGRYNTRRSAKEWEVVLNRTLFFILVGLILVGVSLQGTLTPPWSTLAFAVGAGILVGVLWRRGGG